VVPEAQLAQTDGGLIPATDGWFVVNARDARWFGQEGLGAAVTFEGDDVRFSDFGINIQVLGPGEPNGMYHGENAQEDFLVLHGECLLLVEGEERRLKQWDFVHCPPWTEHIFVGTGDGPCVVLMVGTRPRTDEDDEIVYPVAEVARRHGAGVAEETRSAEEAYASFPRSTRQPYPDGALPEL
jgi:uncharacterized cupin superfamily protein